MHSGVRVTGQLLCRNQVELNTVLSHLQRHIELTRAEPGCLSFEVRQTSDPLVFDVDETFRDDDALDHHRKRMAGSVWGRVTAGIERRYVQHP